MNTQMLLYPAIGLVGGAAIGHYLVKKGHKYTVAIALVGGFAGWAFYNHSVSGNWFSATVTPPVTTTAPTA